MKCTTQQVNISRVWREQNQYNLDPPYQREAGIWSNDKKTKLIDSIFNDYDLPKFYIHDINELEEPYSYNVIDGKQRLSAIWEFRSNQLALSNNFEYTAGTLAKPPKPGDMFRDLDEESQEIFKEYSIDLVLVSKADQEDIEELFSRLNAGESLNAAEQRRALGGEMRDLIIEIGKSSFFHNKLGFKLKRYSQEEVAAKFLKIEHNIIQGGSDVCDLKKKHLDAMVIDNKTLDSKLRSKLIKNVEAGISYLNRVFLNNDPQLSKQSYPQLYYIFCKKIFDLYSHKSLASFIRNFLDEFKSLREMNLQKDEDDRDAALIEYGRLAQQGTNDLGSMETRVEELLKRFISLNPSVVIKDKKRNFNEAERQMIWIRSDRKCEECGKAIEFNEMDADHIDRWADGGKTILENARATCVSCNRAR